MDIEPLPPLLSESVDVTLQASGDGSLTVNEMVDEPPFASVTVRL